GATPHNPYIKDGKAIIAYYQDGVQIYNIDNPASPFRIGYFDTHPQNVGNYPNPPYQGAWGAWPFLPSGVLLVSDMQMGLFVLDPGALLTSRAEIAEQKTSVTLFPNPSSTNIFIHYESAKEFLA